jgi:lincosamide nucleotidyltransferase A/C/D/E
VRSEDVDRLLDRLERLGLGVWVDGGWAVDALLGEQTRPHGDLDLVIEQKHVAPLRRLLESDGYRDFPRDDTSPWNFVLADDAGRQVDIHVIVFDAKGNGLYGPTERGIMYPAASLSGRGVIAGRAVQCIAAEYLVTFHTGYAIRDTDVHDVSALCERFGIAYPPEYRAARRSPPPSAG